MNFDELQKRCDSEIERHLLRALYPNLGPDAQAELQPQYMIDYYAAPVTLPDFAFPDAKIASIATATNIIGKEIHSRRTGNGARGNAGHVAM